MTAQSFIVRIKKDTPADEVTKIKEQITSSGGSIDHEYNTLFTGFSARIPEEAANSLKGHQHIDDMEVDQEMKTQ
ncbi:peptidase inhibitor I9 [Saitoella complicata NRRL Y-17804]|uniref:peptidase inhibitor I9 n=1 Tax=Saitoella complicata (strain BCRC 22490 / CBS 7301 / JCM 7358 / NBRC 10748 / NRRL Y-17804) TaxID=698492 RepID=UPI00086730FC|nr:peptidase inhibitor I9 [Saitoella complicata NRRL Y-17804]ODQ53457.1 peptidase inhibitor I9 [Saitoella complicata NRRL Y-17804]